MNTHLLVTKEAQEEPYGGSSVNGALVRESPAGGEINVDLSESDEASADRGEQASTGVSPDDSEMITIRRFLSPNGNKLYDFRNEPYFADIARKTLAEQRTLLDYNRLLTLFQAVLNIKDLNHSVAEVGSYKGGSSKFLARTFEHFGKTPTIHVFDTFTGHPDQLVATLDGKHKPGLFSDTDAEAVKEYLKDFANIVVHVGTIEERAVDVENEQFSLVHIDVDIYSATVTCLNFFWPRLIKGGIIVVDDYGFSTCKGAKQAVDYFQTINPDCYGWYMHTGQYVLERRGLDSRCDVESEVRVHEQNGRLMEQQQLIQSLQSQIIEAAVKLEATKSFFERKREKTQEGNRLLVDDLREKLASSSRIIDEQNRKLNESSGVKLRKTFGKVKKVLQDLRII